MTETQNPVARLTPEDVATWLQWQHDQAFIGDVLGAGDRALMGVGFARYAPGASNEWTVTSDEALIVTQGAFSVSSADRHTVTAQAGEIIYLRSGTKLVYSAEDAGAELVYVMHPHPENTNLYRDHAALVARFHPVAEAPPHFGDAASQNVALLKRIWGPAERGESYDLRPFFDILAEDVIFKTPVGQVQGKQAVIDYFAAGSETLEYRPFLKPIEYYAAGNVVVTISEELFTVKETGVTHRSDWAWSHELHDRLITKITVMQDLSGVAKQVRDALTSRAAA